jgi:predicted ArsR family transcriptional regulator
MQSTRSRILLYLEEHPRSSAWEISHFLDLTKANIRYHLEILLKEGLVQVTGKRTLGGAGRPILLYNLAPPSLGDNLYPLLRDLLEWIGQTLNPRQAFQDIAGRMIGQEDFLPANRIQRYNQAIGFLNERHYRASWEARQEGPQVSLRHCPYQDLARENLLLCQLDEELLTSLFGREMVLTQKRQFGKDPFSPCEFNPPPGQVEKGS